MARPDDALVSSATQKLKAGDDAAARGLLEQAAKADPKDPRPHFLLGSSLARQGKKAEAVKAFRAALALDPKLPEVHNELGAALLESGRVAEAVVEWEAATHLKPSLCEAWSNLGRARLTLGDAKAAADAFGKGAEACPFDSDLLLDHAMALRQAKDYPASAAAAKRAIELRPEDGDAHLNLALTLQAQGQLEASAQEFKSATGLKPDSVTAWWGWGTLELGRKRFDDALRALEKARALEPSGAICADLVRAAREKGDAKRAQSELASSLEKNPRSLALHLEQVRLALALKRCDEARKALAPLPADKPAVKAVRSEVAGACH